MRTTRLLLWTSLSLFAVACGPPQPKETPQIFTDRTKIGFGQESNSATFIGTTGFGTLYIRNDGVQNLVLNSVSVEGARFATDGATSTTLGFHDVSTVEVRFTPTAAQLYPGTLTITSNAENEPTVTVTLSGCGVVSPNPDLSYCEKATDF